VSELQSELETELRALDIRPAPVADTIRAGRRLRHRRFAVTAGVIAVIAIAAGVPVLTRAGAAPAPPPVSRPTGTATAVPVPTPTAFGKPTLPDGDPVITDAPPGPGAPAGEIAQGTIGARTYRITVGKMGLSDLPKDSYCLDVTGSATGSSADGTGMSCGPFETSAAPATLQGYSGPGGGGMVETTFGSVATDVTYLVLTFSDGQQLKLIPVTVAGQRLAAFIAPMSMTIASLTAHLGTASFDSGQTSTAIPFTLPGQLPSFGLWQLSGQPAPPRATRVIASGTAAGKPWSLTAYEGPWGTCFVPTAPGSIMCEQSPRLATTEIIGGWGPSNSGPLPAEGSAAPGVASVAVTLNNGTTVTARPVTVGNERLFGFLIGAGVSPTRWTAYSASGKEVGSGSVRP